MTKHHLTMHLNILSHDFDRLSIMVTHIYHLKTLVQDMICSVEMSSALSPLFRGLPKRHRVRARFIFMDLRSCLNSFIDFKLI